jgi:hypothetical protein
MTNLNLFFNRVPGLVASIALLVVAMNMPASAQDTHIQRYGEKDTEKTPTEKAAEKEAQKAYERSLGNIPAQKSTDPWGIARGDNAAPNAAPKAATKTASPKPKAKNDTKNDIKTDSAAKQ